MKLGGLSVALALCGCWSETLEDGVFSQDQWAQLQADLPPARAPELCPKGVASAYRNDSCDGLAAFGRTLFFDKRLSQTRSIPREGTASCASCHDPKNWFIDTRAPNNVSLGETGWTKRNSMSLVDAVMKEDAKAPDPTFTWIGAYPTAGAVLDLAIKKAMSSTVSDLAQTIRENYQGFGGSGDSDETIFTTAALALDAYMRRLISVDSPFDRYLAGDASAISDSAKRGFAVFVGPGGCLECHSGPLLGDLQFRTTGVPQVGVADAGRGDQGTFLTPPLRHVAKTAPYMHDGVFATLGEVIAFYRRGGDQVGFPKDPRLVPLDITDDDALDLEAFLGTLTGAPVPVDQTCAVPPCM